MHTIHEFVRQFFEHNVDVRAWSVLHHHFKSKSNKTLRINLDIANTELIKLLGVHIDENLNFTEHISKLCIKASQKVGVLSRLRNLIPRKAKLLLYKSFILPYLTYCHLT